MKLLLLFAAAAPLFGQCVYTVTPKQFAIGAGASIGQIAVNTIAACSWSYDTDSPSWITFATPPAFQPGAGTINFSAAVNVFPVQRTAIIHVADTMVTVTQAAQSCRLTIQPNSVGAPVTGAAGSIAVQTNCAWNASVNQSWIGIPSGTNGIPTRQSTILSRRTRALRHDRDDPRPRLAGAAIVRNRSRWLGRQSDRCTHRSERRCDATTGRITVNTGDGCGWAAFSDVSWMQITTASSGNGHGGFGFSIAANPGPLRTGNIYIGSLAFAVTQQGVAVTPVQLTVVKNAASYASGAVSPGEIVAIGGTNIGPGIPVGLQLNPGGQSITIALGGTQVLFDGVPAPLTYASATQINAIVPYSVAGKTTTVVKVVFQNNASNTVTMPVQATTPGIFAYDASGSGGGAILNQDYSVNAKLRPAKVGEVAAIFCTGGGVTDPVSFDGGITGLPLPLLTAPVTVTIGGVSAKVLYSGGAPTSVAGLTQTDAIVPAGVTPGAAVPVIVTIGGVASQSGITMAVN